MKWLHISFHFEFSETIEKMLDDHDISDFVQYSMIQGKDCDGKHHGSKVYPGNLAVFQALVPDEKAEDLLRDLKAFKDEKDAHCHLQALLFSIEKNI